MRLALDGGGAGPITSYVGYAAGALTVLSLVPQIRRAFRTHRVNDLAWGLIALQGISGALWIGYGLLTRQLPVILTNSGVVVLAATLGVAKSRFGGTSPEADA